MYFKVVTWDTKTDRIFDTYDQAYDYAIMNDDSGHWYIEKVQNLNKAEQTIRSMSMQGLEKHRSVAINSLKQISTGSSDA